MYKKNTGLKVVHEQKFQSKSATGTYSAKIITRQSSKVPKLLIAKVQKCQNYLFPKFKSVNSINRPNPKFVHWKITKNKLG